MCFFIYLLTSPNLSASPLSVRESFGATYHGNYWNGIAPALIAIKSLCGNATKMRFYAVM